MRKHSLYPKFFAVRYMLWLFGLSTPIAKSSFVLDSLEYVESRTYFDVRRTVYYVLFSVLSVLRKYEHKIRLFRYYCEMDKRGFCRPPPSQATTPSPKGFLLPSYYPTRKRWDIPACTYEYDHLGRSILAYRDPISSRRKLRADRRSTRAPSATLWRVRQARKSFPRALDHRWLRSLE